MSRDLGRDVPDPGKNLLYARKFWVDFSFSNKEDLLGLLGFSEALFIMLNYRIAEVPQDRRYLGGSASLFQARKRNPNLNFLVRIFSGGVGVFHVKGWGPKSSVCPSKPRESNFFGGISRDFAGISRGRPKSLRKKVCVQFSSPTNPWKRREKRAKNQGNDPRKTRKSPRKTRKGKTGFDQQKTRTRKKGLGSIFVPYCLESLGKCQLPFGQQSNCSL